MSTDAFPQYERIALDVAAKIADGDLEEHQKISGRSILASEYAVSPETVRKALRLLSNMKVVEVREKSGVVVLSRDNAKRYLDLFQKRRDELELFARFRQLYEQYSSLGKQLMDAGAQMLEARVYPLQSEWSLPNYEVRVSEDSKRTGSSLRSLNFWRETGATVVAIRRAHVTIVSPGPHAELYGGDVVVFVGAPETVSAVERFLNGKPTGIMAER